MPWTLEADDLDALELGLALLGSGGGGETSVFGRMVRAGGGLPRDFFGVTELDPDEPCLAVGVVGSTILLSERLPTLDAAAVPIAALERWLGEPVRAMCGLEHAGMNGLVLPVLAGDRHAIDADLMGRALPRIDQFSLYLDAVPGLVVTITTGAGGVALLDGTRPEDVEVIVRHTLLRAGGWAVLVLGGFRIGDLVTHGLDGTLARALRLGRSLGHTGLDPAAFADEGRWLGITRVVAIEVHPGAPSVVDVQLRSQDGDAVRLVGSSDFGACYWNGERVVEAPDIIAAIDVWQGRPLQLPDMRVGQTVALVVLDAHPWWSAMPHRVDQARLDRLEETPA